MSFPSKFHVFTAVLVLAFGAPAIAAEGPCLLSGAEFARFTGGKATVQPDAVADTMCEYDNGEIQLYSGKDAQAQWNQALKDARADGKKTPLTGIADGAYLLIPGPQGPTAAFVVLNKGQHIVVVGIRPPMGKRPEAVRDQTIAAAKLVVMKLK